MGNGPPIFPSQGLMLETLDYNKTKIKLNTITKN